MICLEYKIFNGEFKTALCRKGFNTFLVINNKKAFNRRSNRNNNPNVYNIAQYANVSYTDVVKKVKLFEQFGLINKTRTKRDIFLTYTDKGKKILNEIQELDEMLKKC